MRVVTASVDSAEQAATLAEESDLTNIEMVSGLDATSAAAAMDGHDDTSRDPFLQPTAFVLHVEHRVAMDVYSSSALGRLSPGDAARVARS